MMNFSATKHVLHSHASLTHVAISTRRIHAQPMQTTAPHHDAEIPVAAQKSFYLDGAVRVSRRSSIFISLPRRRSTYSVPKVITIIELAVFNFANQPPSGYFGTTVGSPPGEPGGAMTGVRSLGDDPRFGSKIGIDAGRWADHAFRFRELLA